MNTLVLTLPGRAPYEFSYKSLSHGDAERRARKALKRDRPDEDPADWAAAQKPKPERVVLVPASLKALPTIEEPA